MVRSELIRTVQLDADLSFSLFSSVSFDDLFLIISDS